MSTGERFVSKKGGILLANLFQGSRSTFSQGSFPSFFAFEEGMWDIHISALLSSPTVSARLLNRVDMLAESYLGCRTTHTNNLCQLGSTAVGYSTPSPRLAFPQVQAATTHAEDYEACPW